MEQPDRQALEMDRLRVLPAGRNDVRLASGRNDVRLAIVFGSVVVDEAAGCDSGQRRSWSRQGRWR